METHTDAHFILLHFGKFILISVMLFLLCRTVKTASFRRCTSMRCTHLDRVALGSVVTRRDDVCLFVVDFFANRWHFNTHKSNVGGAVVSTHWTHDLLSQPEGHGFDSDPGPLLHVLLVPVLSQCCGFLPQSKAMNASLTGNQASKEINPLLHHLAEFFGSSTSQFEDNACSPSRAKQRKMRTRGNGRKPGHDSQMPKKKAAITPVGIYFLWLRCLCVVSITWLGST